MKILSWNVNGVQARQDAVNRLVTELQPDKPEYRLLNQGFRIDYCLMSEELLPYLTKSEILTEVKDTTNSPLLVEVNLPKYL